MSAERLKLLRRHPIPEAPSIENLSKIVFKFATDRNLALASARDELFDALGKKNLPEKDMDYLWYVGALAYNLHRREKRLTGEPYFTHPLSVARILLDNKHIPSDELVDHVAIALAHDLFENTKISTTHFEKLSGTTQTNGVRLLSKNIQSEDDEKLGTDEYFERLLDKGDLMLWRVKIADWVHNLQTTPRSVDKFHFKKKKKAVKLQGKFGQTSRYILPIIRKFPEDEGLDQYTMLKNVYELYRPKRTPDLEPLKSA